MGRIREEKQRLARLQSELKKLKNSTEYKRIIKVHLKKGHKDERAKRRENTAQNVKDHKDELMQRLLKGNADRDGAKKARRKEVTQEKEAKKAKEANLNKIVPSTIRGKIVYRDPEFIDGLDHSTPRTPIRELEGRGPLTGADTRTTRNCNGAIAKPKWAHWENQVTPPRKQED